MRWYDYLIIFFFADAAAAAIMSESIIVGFLIGLAWSLYEDIRSGSVS